MCHDNVLVVVHAITTKGYDRLAKVYQRRRQREEEVAVGVRGGGEGTQISVKLADDGSVFGYKS